MAHVSTVPTSPVTNIDSAQTGVKTIGWGLWPILFIIVGAFICRILWETGPLTSLASSTPAATQILDPLSHRNWKICWELIRESDTKGNTSGRSSCCDNYAFGREGPNKIFIYNNKDTQCLIKYTIDKELGGDYKGHWIWTEKGKEMGKGTFSFEFKYTDMAIGFMRDSLGAVSGLRLTPII